MSGLRLAVGYEGYDVELRKSVQMHSCHMWHTHCADTADLLQYGQRAVHLVEAGQQRGHQHRKQMV